MKAILVKVRSKVSVALLIFATAACAGESANDKLTELRRLPTGERQLAYHQLSEQEKVDLFFQANRRHPPYSGLNDVISLEGKEFLLRLRAELDERGGVPEVLSFLNIAQDVKTRGQLSHEDVDQLRIKGICHLAQSSNYCPTLEAELLAH